MVKKKKFVPRGEPTGEEKTVEGGRGRGRKGAGLLSEPASSHLRP